MYKYAQHHIEQCAQLYDNLSFSVVYSTPYSSIHSNMYITLGHVDIVDHLDMSDTHTRYPQLQIEGGVPSVQELNVISTVQITTRLSWRIT